MQDLFAYYLPPPPPTHTHISPSLSLKIFCGVLFVDFSKAFDVMALSENAPGGCMDLLVIILDRL